MSESSPLISVAELRRLLPERPLLVDCRFDLANPQAGHQAYQSGHLPGAVYADLDRDLSDLGRVSWGLGRHPLPSAEAWSAVMGAWGWAPGRPVIAYDAAGGVMAAARLWWLARVSGVRQVAVLDGGLAAWLADGGELNQDQPRIEATRVDLQYEPAAQATAEELVTAVAAGTTVLLDARPEPRFRGDLEPIDPVAGHVPGALNRPFQLNLDAVGRFRPAEVLRAEFMALLDGRSPRQLVHMCGSGVTACHNQLAMEYAGLAGSRLYPPSWSGWISEPRRRVAHGG
ncbi:sulfurtransferase [Frateuria aurantia]